MRSNIFLGDFLPSGFSLTHEIDCNFLSLWRIKSLDYANQTRKAFKYILWDFCRWLKMCVYIIFMSKGVSGMFCYTKSKRKGF